MCDMYVCMYVCGQSPSFSSPAPSAHKYAHLPPAIPNLSPFYVPFGQLNTG